MNPKCLSEKKAKTQQNCEFFYEYFDKDLYLPDIITSLPETLTFNLRSPLTVYLCYGLLSIVSQEGLLSMYMSYNDILLKTGSLDNAIRDFSLA